MTTVYLVLSNDGESDKVEGVFSDEAGARAFVEGPGRYTMGPRVEAHDVDARTAETRRMAAGERLWLAVIYKPGMGKADFTEEEGADLEGACEREFIPSWPWNGYISVTRWGATADVAQREATRIRTDLMREGKWR